MNGSSRRDVLRVGFVSLPVLVLGARVATAQTTQNAKAAKNVVQYQDSPKNGQQCSACIHFVAPNDCKLVQGPISPNGWCMLFSPKTTK